MQVNFLDINEEPFLEFYTNRGMHYIEHVSSDETGKKIIKCFKPENHSKSDKNASAFVNVKTGVYYCSVCGTFSYRNFDKDFLGRIVDENELIKEISTITSNENQFPKYEGYVKGYGYASSEMTGFAIECQQRLVPELPIVQDYMHERGIDFETLKYMGIGYLPANEQQLVECLTFPYYIGGKVAAIRGRAGDGRKGGIKGSRFIPYNVDDIKTRHVLLLEGESDTIKAQMVINKHHLDITAVGVPGANFKQEFEREFEGLNNIIILPQTDLPSKKFAMQAQDVLGSKRTKILRMPFRRGEAGKDLCDWFLLHTEEEFIELLALRENQKRLYFQNEMVEQSKKETEWIITNLIGRGDKILIGGEQKSLKTFLTMFIMNDLVRGENILGQDAWQVPKPMKILFVEEEGSLDNLSKRAANVIGVLPPELETNLVYLFKPSIKLDTRQNYDELLELIEQHQPDLLILDPLQRMNTADEDSSTEMAIVWDSIHNLTIRFPTMSVIVIHHFKKNGSATNSWDSIRGSSRSAGEVDIGIFVKRDKKISTPPEIILSVNIDGRDIPGTDNELKVAVNMKEWKAKIKPIEEIHIVETTSSKGTQTKLQVIRSVETIITNLLQQQEYSTEELVEATQLPKAQIVKVLMEKPDTFKRHKVILDTGNVFKWYLNS